MSIKIPTQVSVPTPSSGSIEIYYSGSQLCYKNDAGTEICLSEGVTREEVEDLLQNSFADTATITWFYNDASNQFEASIEAATLALITAALQPGDNVSELTNDAGYVDSVGAAAAAPVQSVNGDTGVVVLDKSDIGLGNVDNTSDANKPVSTAQAIADSAVQNFSVQRSNHTGTQTASTISDFAAQVAIDETTTSISITDSVITYNDEDGGATNLQLNVFGTQAEDFLDTTQVSYSGGIQLRKAYTTQSNPTGRYRVQVQIQTEPSSASQNDDFELRIDGVEISLKYEDEAKDTGGDIRKAIVLFGYYQHGAVGTFDIEVWGGNQGGTTEINGVVVEVWRVS